jgi:hypothetical protein
MMPVSTVAFVARSRSQHQSDIVQVPKPVVEKLVKGKMG